MLITEIFYPLTLHKLETNFSVSFFLMISQLFSRSLFEYFSENLLDILGLNVISQYILPKVRRLFH